MVVKSAAVSLAGVLLLGVGTSAQVVFPASDVSGAFEDPNGAEITLPAARSSGPTVITRPKVSSKGTLLRLCGCSDDQVGVDDIRGLSNTWFKDGVRPSSHSFSNLVWAWGQFIDHDIVATIDGTGEELEDRIKLKGERGMEAIMRLHPLVSEGSTDCSRGGPTPKVVNSPIVDAGTVYSDEPAFLENVLRVKDSCMLLTSGPENLLPISVKNSDGKHVFVAGDGRVDEHAVLTMMHTIWMREHNRLCDYMNKHSEYSSLTHDEKFNKAKHVVIAKIQDITVREWLPLLGISEHDLRTATPHSNAGDKPDLSVEFSTAAYRFGHDMVPHTIGPHLTVELFDGNAFYGISNTGEGSIAASSKLDDIAMFCAQSRANELDGKFVSALRDSLFGKFGEDLASRNLYRGRDMRLVDFGALAECFSVDIETDIDDAVQPFIGLLRDNKNFRKQVFGPVQRAILIEQFHRIFFGKGGDWWENRKDDISGFESEIHSATISSVINSNTRSFVQQHAFKVGGGGGKKQAPYGSGGGGGEPYYDDDDDDKFGIPDFPDFPDHFPEF